MRRVLAPRLAVVLGYVMVACAFAWPLPTQLETRLTGDPGGDTGVYVWNQWAFHKEVTEGRNPFTTDQILGLTGTVDLSQHNYTAFLDLVALPLIPLVGVVASFNLVYLAMTVLAGLMTYGLARRTTGASRSIAFLAGVAFAWSPVLIARSTGHFSLAAAAPLPAFLWALVNAERDRSMKNAGLVGLCAAWAALCDAYFGVYCLMIGVLYIATTLLRVSRQDVRVAHRSRVWPLDVAIVSLVGLVAGLTLGGGGEFEVFGVAVRIRGLYTPVLVLTVLLMLRAAVWWQPRLVRAGKLGPVPMKAALVAILACIGPLAPVIYGMLDGAANGEWVRPEILWRSSPRGVDVLALVAPNPNHPVVRALFGDGQATAPTAFLENTASLSLVALGLIVAAIVFAGFRPRREWMWITVGFAALSLGPFIYIAGVNTHIPGPWALLRYVPPISLARMPSRFAIVSTLGVALLMAGALAAIGTRWPERRRLFVALAAFVLIAELWPAPRTLYSAEISPVYDTVALDTRELRLLNLPFGVRDGVSSIGNFRPRSQFNQTRHQKQLIGGYLSRISGRRVARMRRERPTLAILIKMSQPEPLTAEDYTTLAAGGARFVTQSRLGYVVLDRRYIKAHEERAVITAWDLEELQRDQHLVLYRPRSTRP